MDSQNSAMTQTIQSDKASTDSSPNIIFITVDELRFPTAFPKGIETASQFIEAYMPNLYKMWQKGVKFSQFYTASCDCTPARSTWVTGLYTQQTYAFLTRANIFNAQSGTAPQPALNPAFPTYGKLLREAGYDTPYIGKWHLSDFPLSSTSSAAPDYLQPYGFQGLTVPDPIGLAGQGSGATPPAPAPIGSTPPISDAQIATQAVSWLQNRANAENSKPFCLTIGFVNPHDKQYFWGGIEVNEFNKAYQEIGEEPFLKFTTQIVEQANPPDYGYPEVPSNWQSEQSLSARKQPKLHYVFQQFFQYVVGGVSDDSSSQTFQAVPTPILDGMHKIVAPYSYWRKALDMYTQVMTAVDTQVGQVIENIPAALKENTIVVFTSDHGDYASAHGLQGKGGTVYQECFRVPLVVMDLRTGENRLTAEEEIIREQLVSGVDLLPMLVSIGNVNSTDWMKGDYASMYGKRANLLGILGSNDVPGREYAVYSTDELVPPIALNFEKAPEHVIGVVTKSGKLGVYSYWEKGTVTSLRIGREKEYYDYTQGHFEEMDSQPESPAAELIYKFLMEDILPNELQAPLPAIYHDAQQEALEQYWKYVVEADVGSLLKYATVGF